MQDRTSLIVDLILMDMREIVQKEKNRTSCLTELWPLPSGSPTLLPFRRYWKSQMFPGLIMRPSQVNSSSRPQLVLHFYLRTQKNQTVR